MIRAAVIVIREGKVLLVQEATPVIYGKWNWPQGAVEAGEELEAAAVREAKEETGLEVLIQKKVTVIHDPFPGTKEVHVFLGEVVGGALAPNPGEILQAKWFDAVELEEMRAETANPWVVDTIAPLLK